MKISHTTLNLYKSGFPKRGKSPSGGDFKTLKLILVILELQMKSKKKVTSVLISKSETYTRYFWAADEEQKQILGALNGSFWAVLFEGAIAFLIS